MRTQKEILHAFTPVGKLNQVSVQKMMKIETGFKDLALDIESLVPECPDRTAALRKLLESKMTCVQGITHATTAQVPVQTEGGSDVEERKSSKKAG